jgi:hypothetical protein
MGVVPSVKISYWAEQVSPTAIRSFNGIEEFRSELDQHYLTVVHGRPGDLGGLYQLAVHFVSNITLADVAAFIGGGVAYDLLKSGSKAFILRPFLSAFEKLRERNKSFGIDIEELRLEFQDSIVAIDSTFSDAIPSQLGPLLLAIADSYSCITLASGETPFEIRIPVLEDQSEGRICRFRAVLEVDEMLATATAKDYFGFWGLWYDYSRQFRVYDVQRKLLIDDEFMSRERYWQVWEERWRKERNG